MDSDARAVLLPLTVLQAHLWSLRASLRSLLGADPPREKALPLETPEAASIPLTVTPAIQAATVSTVCGNGTRPRRNHPCCGRVSSVITRVRTWLILTWRA